MNTPVSFPLEKEFVPYTESLELKEIGFDEPCICGYSKNTEQLETYSRFLVTKDSFTVDAPTYSQAFRWFREKYGLYHIIHCPAKDVANFTIASTTSTGFNIPSVYSNVELSSYEDAEFACIIKLIELVKNSDK